jgi:hypothetical protein
VVVFAAVPNRQRTAKCTRTTLEELAVILEEGSETLWCRKKIASKEKFADFVPIDLADVVAKRHPPAGTYISRQVIPFRLSTSKRPILAREYLASNRHDTIPVVVIQKISEGLVSNEKRRVRPVDFTLHLGKS